MIPFGFLSIKSCPEISNAETLSDLKEKKHPGFFAFDLWLKIFDSDFLKKTDWGS